MTAPPVGEMEAARFNPLVIEAGVRAVPMADIIKRLTATVSILS